MNATASSSAPARRGRLRKLVWLAGILFLLLIAAYFVVSSSAFVKGIVLPRVGSAMNADLTAGDVAFSPFSRLELRDVKLVPKGDEPVFTAKLMRARYGLLSILGGKMAVDELTLDSPTLTVVENADGTSNLDPLLKGEKSAAESKPLAGKPSPPPSLDVKSVSIKNGDVRHTANLKSGGRQSVELSDLNFNLTNLRNGGTAKLDLSAALAMDNTAPDKTGSLHGSLKGSYTFDLTANLNPAKVNGSGAFTVQSATGRFADFSTFAAALDCEATPTEVKQITLRFTRSGQQLGELRASGPFDAAKSEGKMNILISSIDHRVLNLFGAAAGLDFGSTTINSTNVIELTKGGSVVMASGRLNATRMQITQSGRTTPLLHIGCDYAVTLDRKAKNATLNSFNLSGTQDSRPLLRGELTSPMTLGFGNAVAGTGEAALTLTLTRLNLADWRAFAPDLGLEGTVNATAKLVSQSVGKSTSLELDSQLAGFGAKLGGEAFRDVNAQLQAKIGNKEGGGFAGRFAIANLSGRSGETIFTNLAAKLDLDVATKGKLTTVNQCLLTLSPTTRAKNELRLTGSVDSSNPDAITGALKLTADSLDATAYYDAFAGPTQAEASGSASTTTSTPTDNTEPAAVKLPFRNFTFEAAFGRFYLHEIDAQNVHVVAKLDGGHVQLKPAQLTLNGAPVSATADLDLSVPGFKYDVTFNAKGVPVGPLADSFSPIYHGQAKGTLIASANVKGAGITGRSLKHTLTGSANLSLTNANIQIVGPKVKAVMTPIALVLGTPELLRSPLSYLIATMHAGNGNIEIPTFIAHSDAFMAQSQGVVPIADVLKDSPLNQDIEVFLARNLADKLRFSNVPTNVAYMKLPTFVHLKGTLGSPEAKTDKAVILALTVGGIGGAVGGEAGGILQGVGRLLGGKSSPAAAPTTTNAAPTNAQPANPVNEILNLFKKPKK